MESRVAVQKDDALIVAERECLLDPGLMALAIVLEREIGIERKFSSLQCLILGAGHEQHPANYPAQMIAMDCLLIRRVDCLQIKSDEQSIGIVGFG